jgi:EmrB/QacA subfamily drug resistance transporter
VSTQATQDLVDLDPKRWRALFVIAIASLMVVLDAAIMNIALPKAQAALHISPANRQWVVTSYTLAFGGLLLLGGRIGDYAGRKKVFIIGLIGFAVASALGGFAQDQTMLLAARALQGVFGALLAPAALSLISVTFVNSEERAKAFGVYGAISGVGAAIGLITGGLLTQFLNWRWCLFVNIPMALIAVVLAIPNVHESRIEGTTKYDVPGAVLSTAGFVSLVYGFTQAATPGHSWGSASTLTYLIAGVLLLVAFVVVELKVSHPLLPMGVILDRIRAGSFISQFLVAMGMFPMFLFMTYYFQLIHGWSPLHAGVSFLPFSLGVIVSATVASKLLPKVGPRPLATFGMLVGALGMLYLSTITPTSNYFAHVLPALVIMSLGLGLTFVTVTSTALFNVPFHESGVASAVQNQTGQIGGSLGTALLNTVAISATASYAVSHVWHGPKLPAGIQPPDALVHGYSAAFHLGALSLFVGGVLYFLFVNVNRDHLAQHDDVAAPGEAAHLL